MPPPWRRSVRGRVFTRAPEPAHNRETIRGMSADLPGRDVKRQDTAGPEAFTVRIDRILRERALKGPAFFVACRTAYCGKCSTWVSAVRP